MTDLAALYHEHIAELKIRCNRALERAGFDTLIIGSGAERYQVFDDRPYPFACNPHFKHWLPLTEHPHCWIAYQPGTKPILVYFQPDDYWHVAPAAPSGYWLEHFDVRVISEPSEAAQHLPKVGPSVAIVGENDAGLSGYAPNNPEKLLTYLHFYRAYKSAYERELMRAASARAVRGHRAAEACFRNDGSEYDIHLAYLQATGHTERELPYGNIVALNQHAAVLHYQYQRREKPLQHISFLIDAGASASGYAADITRTYARYSGFFADMVSALDKAQLELCELARPGFNYAQIHLAAHAKVGTILRDFKLVDMDVEQMVESGVTRSFLPHGIGHYLGLQVHDVGGYFKDDSGTLEPKPNGHRYLRLTRELRGNEVLTIEPGIYFIESLLEELVQSEHAGKIAWNEIEALKHYGGIRIEDNICVDAAGGAPENFTREAFAAA